VRLENPPVVVEYPEHWPRGIYTMSPVEKVYFVQSTGEDGAALRKDAKSQDPGMEVRSELCEMESLRRG